MNPNFSLFFLSKNLPFAAFLYPEGGNGKDFHISHLSLLFVTFVYKKLSHKKLTNNGT